ncbi:MAG: hypothetical protein ABIH82_04805 [Candidatus Woesearchaeota archaeon]
MDDELLLDAREELKRLEHIIYVTLKYTRTVDVLINALQRLVDIYDLIIEAMLEKAKADELISVLPKSPALRVTRLGETYPTEEKLKIYLTFYTFIKNLLNSPYTKREEFRRHVTFVVDLGNSTAEIDIDNLVNCERVAHQFLRYAWEKVIGKIEED